MLIDRRNLRLHLIPAGLALLLTAMAIGWYCLESWSAGQWLGGGSLPALVLGSFAALIILAEMLLWPRKALRRFRLIPTKYWLAAHLWFGLACLPLAIFHTGFHLGGLLPATLIVLLVATIFSGIFGAVMQQVLPRWMLRRLPAETIYSEIDHVAQQAVRDADALVRAACGPRDNVMTMQLSADSRSRFQEMFEGDTAVGLTRAIVIGAPREAGRLRGRSVETETVTRQRQDARSLWSAYDELRPFLLDGKSRGELFNDGARSTGWFRLLRHACGEDAEKVIGPLERLADQRRQFNTQQKVHRWLHGWLPVHIGMAVALCVFLVVHVVTALRYW